MKKRFLFSIALAILTANIVANAQWTKHSDFPTGGRILDMTTDNNGTVYILTAYSSDIFYTTNNGVSWLQMPNTLNQWTLTDIEVDKTTGTLYAGGIDGLHWTNDKGQSWQVKQFFVITQFGPSLVNIPVIALKQGTGTIVAHEQDGMNVSTDGGLTWTNHYVPNFQHAHSLTFFPNGELFAGTENGVFKSTDDGATWSILNGGVQGMRITSIAKNHVNGFLFTSADFNNTSNDTSGAGIYLSMNNGLTWTLSSNGIVNRVSKEVMVDSATGDVYATTESGVYRSVDNGVSWVLTNNNLQDISSSCIEKTSSGFYLGTGRTGVAHSTLPTTGWTYINNGIRMHSFVDFEMSGAGNFFLLDGNTSCGVYRKLSQGSWQQPGVAQLPPGAGRVLEKDNNGNIYAAISSPSSVPTSTRLFRLLNNSSMLSDLTGNIPVPPQAIITNIFDIESSATGALYVLCRVYLSSASISTQVFRSTDNGNTFVNIIQTPVAGIQLIRDLELTPTGKIFMAVGSGAVANEIAVTPDQGVTITTVTTGTVSLSPGFSMAADNNDTLYVMSMNALYKAWGNSGWAALPVAGWSPGNDAGVYLDNSGNIYVSADNGVFYSKAGSSAWSNVSAGIPSFSGISGNTMLRLEGLRFDANDTVYAYSSNVESAANPFHGIYKLSPTTVNVGTVASTNDQITIYPNPAGSRIFLGGAGNMEPDRIVVYDQSGREVLRVPELQSKNNEVVEVDIAHLSSGVYFIELKGRRNSVYRKFLKF